MVLTATSQSLPELVAGPVSSLLLSKAPHVWTLPPGATVFSAIELMASKSIGAIPIVDDGVLTGILSERDYARKVILSGRSSKDTLVRDIMTSPVITISPEDSIDGCMRLMSERRIRHLPVIEGGQLVAIVSIGDIIKAVITAQAEAIRHLNAYIAGSYPV